MGKYEDRGQEIPHIWTSSNKSYEEALKAFHKRRKTTIYGVSGSQKSFLYSQSRLMLGERPTVIVVHDKEHREIWERDLAFFLPHVKVETYARVESTDFQLRARSLEDAIKQMHALSMLAMKEPIVVIATAEEAAQKCVDPIILRESILQFSVQDEIGRDVVIEKLVRIGYERVDQVEYRGHFSVRGDILDVFPVHDEKPYRIEFFGDEIDTIRTFDILTQRSINSVDSLLVTPMSMFEEKKEASLASYIEEGCLIFDEPRRIEEAIKNYIKEDVTHKEDTFLWLPWLDTMRAESVVLMSLMQQKSSLSVDSSVGITAKGMTSFERQMHLLVDEIKDALRLDRQVVLCIYNQQRREAIERLLIEHSIQFTQHEYLVRTPNEVLFMKGVLSEGFELPNSQLIVITEGNIFGTQKRKLRKNMPNGQKIEYFSDIAIGDYVVHALHGIGKYKGLKTIEVNGLHRDYLEIAYAGTDKLFVPADNLDQLQKYIGNEGDVPKLHSMNSRDWVKAKKKAEKSVHDLAEKLVEIYAKRELVDGFAFLPDQPWQQEFEDDFPYEETEDQLRAVEEIKRSMEKPRPMDHLLCGDVGFGKTEVAMRAMFKAVMSGKQVAMLVPTTILSEQHFKTFEDRFSQFGIRVAVLNRFTTTKRKKEILTGILEGSIDILVATHSLLNKRIKFKDLGFLVVDEEQRFGVAQKEKWKEWASNIDILTLSATPIPRTLHMSLVGVREMSTIHTPPHERVPVQTYVVEYDMTIIADAIRRELQRGGQVFFVYNRVQSIDHMARILEEAMPNIRLAIAHGQMKGNQMEAIMQDFTEGVYDVLLSTSIIETGLDIPNANTIIIYDADHMGLSQLYQMRGRVGRSRQRGYAYLLYRPDKILTEASEKRLKAIQEFTELGAGFKVAMRDLEIRGAGNLLGSQQHGNISSVGFAMYSALLEEAIHKVQNKGIMKKEPLAPSIDVEVDAFIDESYIPDSARKISMYQRLLGVSSLRELDEFIDELVDRFGTPTKPVERLLRLARVKERARKIGLRHVVGRNYKLTFTWEDETRMEGWDLSRIPSSLWGRLKSDSKAKPMKWIYTVEQDVLKELEEVMTAFEYRCEVSE